MWGKPSSELSVGNMEGGTWTVTKMWQSPGSDKKTAALTPKDILNTENTVFFAPICRKWREHLRGMPCFGVIVNVTTRGPSFFSGILF